MVCVTLDRIMLDSNASVEHANPEAAGNSNVGGVFAAQPGLDYSIQRSPREALYPHVPLQGSIAKPGSSPTPGQGSWNQSTSSRQTLADSYPAYNQISPSRSPSGPTYTQLSGGATRASVVNIPGQANAYQTTAGVPGMWQWHGQGGNQEGAAGQTPNANAPQVGSQAAHQAPGELQDMLQMLDHHSAAAPFEDLNMFNANFE